MQYHLTMPRGALKLFGEGSASGHFLKGREPFAQESPGVKCRQGRGCSVLFLPEAHTQKQLGGENHVYPYKHKHHRRRCAHRQIVLCCLRLQVCEIMSQGAARASFLATALRSLRHADRRRSLQAATRLERKGNMIARAN